jgi:hypothetical protein
LIPVFRLLWLLAQELFGRGEGVEQLIVQVVAVGDDQYGGVIQRQHDFAGVEHHRERLAAALRVPHHAAFAIARGLPAHARHAVLFRRHFLHHADFLRIGPVGVTGGPNRGFHGPH